MYKGAIANAEKYERLQEAYRELLRDYHQAQSCVLWEMSGTIRSDIAELDKKVHKLSLEHLGEEFEEEEE